MGNTNTYKNLLDTDCISVSDDNGLYIITDKIITRGFMAQTKEERDKIIGRIHFQHKCKPTNH